MERMNDRVGEDFMTYSIGKIESMDIDTQSDFDMAEYFHKQRHNQS
jgi:CMP-N-acetylneuraminic acid synthetase